jgi:PhnB protein
MSEYRKTTLAPMLSVRNGAKALEFYQEALAAQVLTKLENNGSIVAHLSIHGAEFWIADESPEHKNFSPESLGGATTRMILSVNDPDSFYDRAVSGGAKAISPVQDHDYGWRVGRVMDPFGHHWEIGKPLA